MLGIKKKKKEREKRELPLQEKICIGTDISEILHTEMKKSVAKKNIYEVSTIMFEKLNS